MFCPWGKYFFTVDKTFLLCFVVCKVIIQIVSRLYCSVCCIIQPKICKFAGSKQIFGKRDGFNR